MKTTDNFTQLHFKEVAVNQPIDPALFKHHS
jgi:hypothetical protein